jgi:hypothetical protein
MSWTCTALISWLDPNLCRAVDHYCERTSAGWYAEPLNAISNLAFLFAGWAAWRSLTKANDITNTWLLSSTVALIPLVGLGSFVFHTLATRWAEWLDVIPIVFFMTFYIWLALKIFLDWLLVFRLSATGLFVFATFASEAFVSDAVLWGGAMYVPTVVILSFFTAVTASTKNCVSKVFVFASGGFMAAYVLRTIDVVVCPFLPTGTHMMWHLLNAMLMYFLMHSLVAQRFAPSQAARVTGESRSAQFASSD